MKAPARAPRSKSRSKSRVRHRSVFIYRAYKEGCPAAMKSLDFLMGEHSFPQQVALRLVSSEASRLSKSSRTKAITVEELDAAVTLVKRKIQSRVAA